MNIPGYDAWKLASPDDEGPYLVSPCCKGEYSERDFITEDNEKYKCNECDELFMVPETDAEYEERMRDHWADVKMDEDRLER
jgi:hypothetical protein